MTGVRRSCFGGRSTSCWCLREAEHLRRWKGRSALSVHVPIVIVCPRSCCWSVRQPREAALRSARGWRVVTRVVLPTSLSGLVKGALRHRAASARRPAAVHRRVAQGLTGNERVDGLAADREQRIQSPRAEVVTRASGAALTLVLMILLQPDRARRFAKEPPRDESEIDTKNKDATDVSPRRACRPAARDRRARRDGGGTSQAHRTSVTVTDLHAYYGGESIKGISMKFPANEVTGLIGPQARVSRRSCAASRMHEEILERAPRAR